MNPNKIQIAFSEIFSEIDFPEKIKSIATAMLQETANRKTLKELLGKHNIEVKFANTQFLRLLLEYIKIALKDELLSNEEKRNIIFLKKLFKISPGDFHLHHSHEIEQIIAQQLVILYKDNIISQQEAIFKVDLQEVFDLSFDQMNEYSKKEAIASLQKGGNPNDLDVFFPHDEYSALGLDKKDDQEGENQEN